MKIGFLKIISISLVAFAIIVFFLALNIDKKYSTEKIVGKSVDNFEIKFLNNDEVFKKQDLTNDKYHLINIWASWCVPCREEHSFLMSLKDRKNLKIIGLNYKDNIVNAKSFLKELGNPYEIILLDEDGVVSIEWGAYGVPETFLVHEKKILKKIIGSLNSSSLLEIKEIIK